MRMPHPTTVDFETFGIEGRPDYPPAPVGVAIKPWGKRSRYYAWGHLNGENTHTVDEARAALGAAYDCPDGVLFHNAKFDLDVAETEFGLPLPPWDRIHDTTFLLFLAEPYAREHGLKPAAERLLGMAPEERDAVADWLHGHQPVAGVKIGRSPNGREPPGKYIAYAPPDLVGPYACGDCDRTEALFRHLWPRVSESGMLPAYDRERRLVPILLEMERRGLAVDVRLLRQDVERYEGVLIRCESWVRKKLGASAELNLESGAQLMEALLSAGLADEERIGNTPTGKMRSDKDTLAACVTDRRLSGVLRYMAQLRTCLYTFMWPWLETAERSGGTVYTTWHATRGEGGGARTGRFSSSPNFQNVPKEFDPIFSSAPRDGLPKSPVKGLPPLPLCRRYIVAREDEVLIRRDFASQELRILAHFEDGAMMRAYREKPDTDSHAYAAEVITRTTGVTVTRKKAKTIGFAILYGAGLPKLAAQLGCGVDEAKRLLDAYFSVFPGVRVLKRSLKMRAAAGEPIRTAGGRLYYVEPPRTDPKTMRVMNFDYKLLNYLVQGSAADQTKDAMMRYVIATGRVNLLASVHDELLCSVPREERDSYMAHLRDAMDADAGLDVPMLSDGAWGDNWADMEESYI